MELFVAQIQTLGAQKAPERTFMARNGLTLQSWLSWQSFGEALRRNESKGRVESLMSFLAKRGLGGISWTLATTNCIKVCQYAILPLGENLCVKFTKCRRHMLNYRGASALFRPIHHVPLQNGASQGVAISTRVVRRRSEVIVIKGELSGVVLCLISVDLDAGLLVISDPLLKEVCLSLE